MVRSNGSGQVALVDSAVDGVAWGYVGSKIPVPEAGIGPLTSKELVGAVAAAVYEKFYMKRRWSHALIAAGIAYLVGRWMSA